MKNPISPKQIMKTTVLTETFQVERAIYQKRRMMLAALLMTFSIYGNYRLATEPHRVGYFLTRSDGTITPIVPISKANHETEFVLNWATDKVIKTFTFDYANYRSQFQDIQANMTAFGWANYMQALQDSGNLGAIIGNSYVSTAVPTGPAELIKEGLFLDRYAWRIRLPILVTYQSSLRRTTQDMLLDVVVARMPEHVNADGLAIRQITPQRK